MTSIIQRSVPLTGRSQLRNADRLARDWAVSHAGAYKSQADKQLRGSLPVREWHNDEMTLSIRVIKLDGGEFKQMRLVAASYAPAGAEPYYGCIITYAYPETEQPGAHCIAMAFLPDALAHAELPWDDKAGPAGLERAIDSISSDRTHADARPDDAQPIAAIDDLFSGVHDSAIVLTEDGQQDAELRELADAQGGWAVVVPISASQQLALSRHLPIDQLPDWIHAKIALFSRYPDADGNRLRMTQTDPEPAAALIHEERERIADELLGSNVITLLHLLERVSLQASVSQSLLSMANDVTDAAEALGELGADASPGSMSIAAQQRINTLEDKLQEAETAIAELRERLAQYEPSYDANSQPDAEQSGDRNANADPESPINGNRHNTVIDAIADPERFPKLRFLTNCDKALANYGKPRPNGVEIVAALEAINKLARAWYNTPNGAIGPWDNYFTQITGWKHADDESEATMSLYGAKRSFSDQENERHVTITRHLTYQGSSSGLQIYFDKDDVTDTFIVGYIGEHLPYATARS